MLLQLFRAPLDTHSSPLMCDLSCIYVSSPETWSNQVQQALNIVTYFRFFFGKFLYFFKTYTHTQKKVWLYFLHAVLMMYISVCVHILYIRKGGWGCAHTVVNTCSCGHYGKWMCLSWLDGVERWDSPLDLCWSVLNRRRWLSRLESFRARGTSDSLTA